MQAKLDFMFKKILLNEICRSFLYNKKTSPKINYLIGQRKGQIRYKRLQMNAEETQNTFQEILLPLYEQVKRKYEKALVYTDNDMYIILSEIILKKPELRP